MTAAIQANSYRDRAYQHFLMACDGEEPISDIGKKNLHPSSYQISLLGRVVHLVQSIVLIFPLVNLIVDYVVSFFSQTLPTPKRIDRDYRIVDERSVPSRLAAEKIRARLSQGDQSNNPLFTNPQQALGVPFSEEGVQLKHITVDTAWMQGRRPTMEDEHLAKTFSVKIGDEYHDASVFGVFDGHGGPQASRFLKANMVSYLKKYLEKNKTLSDAAIFNALKLAFVDLDRQFKGTDGSTACVALILNDNLWVVNSGDTRAVLTHDRSAIQLSDDAKPDTHRFKKRIEKRGGEVLHNDVARVNGVLAVGGAIGDHYLIGKGGYGCLTPRPKITKTPLKEIYPEARLIIACDGLWDVCSSKQAVRSDFTAKELMHAAYNAGSQDNISVMTVYLPGQKRQSFFGL